MGSHARCSNPTGNSYRQPSRAVPCRARASTFRRPTLWDCDKPSAVFAYAVSLSNGSARRRVRPARSQAGHCLRRHTSGSRHRSSPSAIHRRRGTRSPALRGDERLQRLGRDRARERGLAALSAARAAASPLTERLRGRSTCLRNSGASRKPVVYSVIHATKNPPAPAGIGAPC